MINLHDQGILLVEDDPADVFLTQRAFRLSQIINPLIVVRDGEEAISYLIGEGKYAEREKYPLPRLIFLDLKLPRMSGLEFLTWLRQQEGLKRILVVVMTSSSEAPDINRAHDLGISCYLVKPVDFNALMEMIKSINMALVLLSEKPHIDPVAH
ncbi:MAG: response regulator [Verrucomicrobiota bacterium]|nr:response regulator [Verrucomicrobiota bacterium]